MIQVVLLGSGNVAKHLYEAFFNSEIATIIQCYNRAGNTFHQHQNESIITQDYNTIKKADLYILAVSDDAIAHVASKLPFSDRLVVHISGSTPIEAIGTNNRTGVFYPLQTFSQNKSIDFNTIPICIEAEYQQDFELLNRLALSLTKHCYTINSKQRNALHVAAVFVNNFTNHLYHIGSEICEKEVIPFQILQPLISETAKKIENMSPSLAQTGPAKRDDSQTIQRHLDTLSNPTHKEIYKVLTTAIKNNYGKEL